MKTTRLIPAMLLFLFFLGSCNMGSLKGIKIPESKKDYVGTWQSTEMLLVIDQSGQVNYEKQSGSMHKSINGPIQKFEGDNFVVGALGFNTTFVVNEKPHKENGVWVMTVDGIQLTRE